MEVPPGASNFRDVTPALTPGQGTGAADYPFTISVASTTNSTASDSATGTLQVTSQGVVVSLNPPSGATGSGFQLTVTNTGSVSDTYNLSLIGPGALVASLATNQIALAPGASRIIPITTGSASFAVAGNLDLTAMAVSQGNRAVNGEATASLSVPSTQSVSAALTPSSENLGTPGNATFTLVVNNTGNTEDLYTAFIVSTSGPITANLVGLDGLPTQSVPLFRIPGLSTGTILLQTNLAAIGQGTVTVEVKSLSNGSIVATATATVTSGVVTPPATDGPQVIQVLRYGIHWEPTTLVLRFDQPLDPSTTQNVSNYVIIGPGGHRDRIRSAVYDPTTQTVTLHPARRVNLHHNYKLTVIGAGPNGVSDSQGLLLDGKNTGVPGSNYHTILNWKNVVLPKHIPPVSSRDSAFKVQRSIAGRGHSVLHVKVVVKPGLKQDAHGSHVIHGDVQAQNLATRKPVHVIR